MPPSPQPRVFISYARSDGGKYATWLREKLEGRIRSLTAFQKELILVQRITSTSNLLEQIKGPDESGPTEPNTADLLREAAADHAQGTDAPSC